MVSDEKAVSLMLNNGEIFSHRFTPHIWQKIQLLVIEEPLTLAWIAKTQKFPFFTEPHKLDHSDCFEFFQLSS